MTTNHIYISNADSGDIRVLSVHADAQLHVAQTLILGGQLMPMAMSPDAATLYVARRSEPFAVLRLSISPSNGQLDYLDEAALPASMAYISTDHSGRYLFAASYQGDCLTVSPVALDGAVGGVQQVIPTQPHAHAIVPSPSNRHVLATSLGGDQVLQFHFDETSGSLTPNDIPFWSSRPGAGPRHLRFHPNGQWVYVLNELDASLDVLAFDDPSGQLQAIQNIDTLPPGLDGAPWAADVQVSHDGQWLFTCERTSSTVATFRVNAENGQLTAMGHTSTEDQPRSFAISADNNYLLVAGQRSNHLSNYRISQDTGQLDLIQRLAIGDNPNWIAIKP